MENGEQKKMRPHDVTGMTLTPCDPNVRANRRRFVAGTNGSDMLLVARTEPKSNACCHIDGGVVLVYFGSSIFAAVCNLHCTSSLMAAMIEATPSGSE